MILLSVGLGRVRSLSQEPTDVASGQAGRGQNSCTYTGYMSFQVPATDEEIQPLSRSEKGKMMRERENDGATPPVTNKKIFYEGS